MSWPFEFPSSQLCVIATASVVAERVKLRIAERRRSWTSDRASPTLRT